MQSVLSQFPLPKVLNFFSFFFWTNIQFNSILFFQNSSCLRRSVGSPNTSTFERQMAPRGNAQMWSPRPYNLWCRRLFPFISLSPSFIVLTHATTTLREGSLCSLYFSSFIFSFSLSESLNQICFFLRKAFVYYYSTTGNYLCLSRMCICATSLSLQQ